jgi:hypothetical protein
MNYKAYSVPVTGNTSFAELEVDETCVDDERMNNWTDLVKKMSRNSMNTKSKLGTVDNTWLKKNIFITICHVCFKVKVNTQVADHVSCKHPELISEPLSLDLFV